MTGKRTLADQTNMFCRVVFFNKKMKVKGGGNMIMWRMPPLSSILVPHRKALVADCSSLVGTRRLVFYYDFFLLRNRDEAIIYRYSGT